MHAHAFANAPLLALIATFSPHQDVTQDERWHLRREVRWERYGAALTVIGDVDGDGIADVASTAADLAQWDPDQPAADDVVRIQSGATLATLGEIRSPNAFEFGIDLAAVGDEDSDGFRDLAVMEAIGPTYLGRISIWSVRTLELLRELRLPTDVDAAGGGIDSLDDRDGDGREELLVALPSHRVANGVQGRFLLIGSRDGSTLSTWDASIGRTAIGGTWSASRDLDGEGKRDFAYSELYHPSGPDSIVVRIFSGADSSRLAERTITAIWASPQGRLDANLDMSGDGRNDLALIHDRQLVYLSGVDLTTIRTRSLPSFPEATEIAGLGDSDGDGKGDVAIATVTDYSDDSGGTYTATLSIYGANGAWLDGRTESGTRVSTESRRLILARNAAIDGDLDGYHDLAYAWSEPGHGDPEHFFGQRIEVRSPRRHLPLATREVEDLSTPNYVGHRVVDDLDDDGVTETFTIEEEWRADGRFQLLALRNGVDGRVIWRRPIGAAGQIFPISCYGIVPDVDGDAVADLLTPPDEASAELVLRSSRDGALLRTLAGSNAYDVLAVASTMKGSDGSSVVVLGRPGDDIDHDRSNGSGTVTAYHLPVGTKAWSVSRTVPGELGWDVETIGDFDGDGDGDLALAACDEWWIVDGSSGEKLASLPVPRGQFALDDCFRFAPDDDGDGRSHLIVGSTANIGGGETSVYELPSLTKLATRPYLRLRDHVLAADLDLDGVPDIVGFDPNTTAVVLSTATLQDIARLPFWWREFQSYRDPSLPREFGLPGLHPVAMHNFRREGVSLLDLPSLFMKAPAGAVVGGTVTIDVAGGEPGQLVGLYVVELDGVALDRFAAFDALDGGGFRQFSDVILPDAAGTSWLLRAFAIGRDGSLARSNHERLEID